MIKPISTRFLFLGLIFSICVFFVNLLFLLEKKLSFFLVVFDVVAVWFMIAILRQIRAEKEK